MNEVLRMIYQRRAVRRFKADAVAVELLQQIIDAGRMAPSAINMQPWRFTVLTHADQIRQLSAGIRAASVKALTHMSLSTIVHSIADFIHAPKEYRFLKEDDVIFHGAPAVIFLSAPKSNEWAALDVGMCAQNMMLAAESLGLNTCPIGLAKFVEYSDVYARLQIPSSEHVHLAVIVGYGVESPAPKERRRDNVSFVE